MERHVKTGLTKALALSTLVPPPAATSADYAYAYRRRQRGTPDAMANPERRVPPWSVAEVLGTGQLHNSFVRALLARFRLNGLNGTPLSTDLRKGGGVHAFLGRLIAKAVPVQGLAELTFLWVDPD